MLEREVLFRVLDTLDSLHIPYMIVGSFASTYWGRPRLTHDADLLVEIPSSKAVQLAQALEPEFYVSESAVRDAVSTKGQFNVIHTLYPFKVDLWIRTDTAFDRERFRRRRAATMFGRRVWVTSAEDTILSKLLWYRESPALGRQMQDALEVFEIQEPNLDQEYLDGWATILGVRDLLTAIRDQASSHNDAN